MNAIPKIFHCHVFVKAISKVSAPITYSVVELVGKEVGVEERCVHVSIVIAYFCSFLFLL